MGLNPPGRLAQNDWGRWGIPSTPYRVSSKEGDTGWGQKGARVSPKLGTIGPFEVPPCLIFIVVPRSTEIITAQFLPP